MNFMDSLPSLLAVAMGVVMESLEFLGEGGGERILEPFWRIFDAGHEQGLRF
jgi:hypothetical protein